MIGFEKNLVRIACALNLPLGLFILGWYSSAGLSLSNIVPISLTNIKYASFGGLGSGILLDIVFLRQFIRIFYTIKIKYLIAIFIFWSGVFYAIGMGSCLLNLLWGTMAGIYTGRRNFFQGATEQHCKNEAKKTAWLSSAVIWLLACLSSFFLLGETHLADQIGVWLGFRAGVPSTKYIFIAGIVFSFLLTLLQYRSAMQAALLAFRWGKNRESLKIVRKPQIRSAVDSHYYIQSPVDQGSRR